MNTIGDIIVNILLQTIVPLITLFISGATNLISTVLTLQLGAVTEQATSEDVAYALPLIVFAPGRLSISDGYVYLPMEVMAIACFVTTLILAARAKTIGMRLAALFVGTFAPPMIVQVIDLLIYNVNLLLPTLTNGFFTVIPTNIVAQAGQLAVDIRIIYGDAGWAALIAAAILAVYGGISLVSMFLLRAVFHIGGGVSGVLVAIVALHSIFAGLNKKALQNFFVFLVTLVLIAILAQACIRSYHSLWTYTAAVFYQYSDHFVLRPRINAFVAAVYEYLEATDGDVAAAKDIIERPATGCEDACSELLRQQMAAATGATVLPLLLLVVVGSSAVLWFRGIL